jgi:hypothetical protein
MDPTTETVYQASIQSLRKRVEDNEIQIHRMTETIRRYKKALGQIHAKLSVTRVPSQKWVKTLHGELFVIAHFELEE